SLGRPSPTALVSRFSRRTTQACAGSSTCNPWGPAGCLLTCLRPDSARSIGSSGLRRRFEGTSGPLRTGARTAERSVLGMLGALTPVRGHGVGLRRGGERSAGRVLLVVDGAGVAAPGGVCPRSG